MRAGNQETGGVEKEKTTHGFQTFRAVAQLVLFFHSKRPRLLCHAADQICSLKQHLIEQEEAIGLFSSTIQVRRWMASPATLAQ